MVADSEKSVAHQGFAPAPVGKCKLRGRTSVFKLARKLLGNCSADQPPEGIADDEPPHRAAWFAQRDEAAQAESGGGRRRKARLGEGGGQLVGEEGCSGESQRCRGLPRENLSGEGGVGFWRSLGGVGELREGGLIQRRERRGQEGLAGPGQVPLAREAASPVCRLRWRWGWGCGRADGGAGRWLGFPRGDAAIPRGRRHQSARGRRLWGCGGRRWGDGAGAGGRKSQRVHALLVPAGVWASKRCGQAGRCQVWEGALERGGGGGLGWQAAARGGGKGGRRARSMWAARLEWAQGYRRREGSTRGRGGTGRVLRGGEGSWVASLGGQGWGRKGGVATRVRQAVVGRGGPAGATRGAGGVALMGVEVGYAAEVQGVRTRGPTERGSRSLFKVVDGAEAHGTRRGVLGWRQRRPAPEPVWRGIDGLGHRGRRRDGGGKVDGRVGRGIHWLGTGALNGGGGRWAGGRPEAWQARMGTRRQGGRRPRKRVGTGNAEGV
eukprot:s2333_g24.t1